MKKAAALLIVIVLLGASAAAAAEEADAPAEFADRIISETAILIDVGTGQILFEKDMHMQMRPASITKVMTALLALENGDMGDIIIMTHEAVSTLGEGAANISLAADEELTLEQAMYAMSLSSANDASNGVAEHIGGTIEGFIALMNDRARELGAMNTNFENSHGMPNDDHLSTAYDMALITIAAINTPGFTEIFSALEYEMPPTNIYESPRLFRARNPMMSGDYIYEGIIAEKTGWTRSSQHTLVTAAERDGRTLVAVVIKSPMMIDKYEDMTLLLDYGFDGFEFLTFTAEELSRRDYSLKAAGGDEITVDITAEEGFRFLAPKGVTKSDVDIRYTLESEVLDRELIVSAKFSLDARRHLPAYAELGEIMLTAILTGPYGEHIPDGAETGGEQGGSGSPGIYEIGAKRMTIPAISVTAGILSLNCLVLFILLSLFRRKPRSTNEK